MAQLSDFAALRPWLRVSELLQRALDRFPYWLFVAVIPLVTVIHGGFDLQFPNNGIAQSTESFPSPLASSEASSYGLRTVSWMLGITSDGSYVRLNVAIYVIVVILSGLLARRVLDRNSAKVVVALLWLGPIGVSMTTNLGRPDCFVIAGGVILGIFARNISWGVLGALVMCAGNPEQAVVATLCFLLVSFGLSVPGLIRASSAAFMTSVVCYLGIFIVLRNIGQDSRLGYFARYFRQSLTYFLQSAPLQIYTGFGLAVLFICLTLTAVGVRRAALIVLGVLVVPLLVTATTLDQTRVLVSLTVPSICCVLVWSVPRSVAGFQRLGVSFAPALLIILVFILPAFSINYPGFIRPPYKTPVELFFNPAAGG